MDGTRCKVYSGLMIDGYIGLIYFSLKIYSYVCLSISIIKTCSYNEPQAKHLLLKSREILNVNQ